jgi:hypothetical protein
MALAVQQDNIGVLYKALRATNINTGALAAQFTGDVQVTGKFWVGGTWSMNGAEVYHSASLFNYADQIASHQGIGSGLDADKLDGYDVTLLPGNKCNGMACLCVTFSVGNVRCAKLENRF